MQKLLKNMTRKNKVILSAVGVCLLGTGTAYGTYEATKETVTVNIDGKTENIRTHADTIQDLFNDLELDIRDEDYISPSKNAKIQDNMKIMYKSAIPVQLTINDERRTIWTTAQTVEELLSKENITTSEHDVIKPSLNTKITKNMKLNIQEAVPITLKVGSTEKQVWSTSTTVADFLKEQNITLNELDKVEPDLSQKLKENDQVMVTRVEKVTDVVEEPVAFQVVQQKDKNLEKGQQKVIQNGEKGMVKKHYEVILENGKEVARKLIKSETEKESVDKIVAVGTKAPQQSTTVSRGTTSTAKEFYVVATAYTGSCNGCSGKTSTGFNLKANPDAKVIAVDPNVIPLGSKVYVEGYGYAIAADTGSKIKGKRIDVFFPNASSAYRWGRKQVKVRVLK
ncbi:G5 and 3D domain-containing protein [Bacillus alveayuensis]|uniref:G5 and 3D domain-containing protein n=1 Tax=Aeribacillus alveayuensis TaxID=279215 RepID=UPI0005CCC7AE|nr:G5 and 3D domain-containing protein [Bacillus alveayuensis]